MLGSLAGRIPGSLAKRVAESLAGRRVGWEAVWEPGCEGGWENGWLRGSLGTCSSIVDTSKGIELNFVYSFACFESGHTSQSIKQIVIAATGYIAAKIIFTSNHDLLENGWYISRIRKTTHRKFKHPLNVFGNILSFL